QMLAGCKRYRNALRNLESEYVLGVLGRSGRITMAPLRKDLVNVRKLPIAHTAIGCGIDSGLLGELSRGGMFERFSRVDASRHRLPVLGKISALHQQNVELPRINDDEDRNGLLVGCCHSTICKIAVRGTAEGCRPVEIASRVLSWFSGDENPKPGVALLPEFGGFAQ